MDATNIFQQMIKFNKTGFDTTFDTISNIQDQAEKLTTSIIDQTKWYPQESKKMMSEWIQSCKTSRDMYKKTVDESFKTVSSWWSRTE